MSKKEIISYLLESNTSVSLIQMVISLAAAVLLALFLYFVYRATFRGVVYSKNFNLTLVLIVIITTMAMLVIGNNLALSLGMVGSLSIIRFRTAIKEPRDIAFLFWAIAIGLSCGAAMYSIAILGSLVIALVLFAFKNDLYDVNSYLLVVRGPAGALPRAELETLLGKGVHKFKLRMQNSSAAAEEITYEISGKADQLSALSAALRGISGVESFNLVSYSGEIVG